MGFWEKELLIVNLRVRWVVIVVVMSLIEFRIVGNGFLFDYINWGGNLFIVGVLFFRYRILREGIFNSYLVG